MISDERDCALWSCLGTVLFFQRSMRVSGSHGVFFVPFFGDISSKLLKCSRQKQRKMRKSWLSFKGRAERRS